MLQNQSNMAGYTTEQIQTIRNTVAQNATPSELGMFLTLARKYNLDPLAHEIWFIQIRGKNTIITSRDGYLKIANENHHFSGIEADVVCENDDFTKINGFVKHSYKATERGKIIGAYALVYRNDRQYPAYFFAPMKDYYKDTQVWKQYPHAMIIKVAESMALKRAFSISGLVTREEIEEVKQNEEIKQEEPAEIEAQLLPAIEEKPKDLQERKLEIWKRFLALTGNDANEAKNSIQFITGQIPSSRWSEQNMADLEAYCFEQEAVHMY